MTFTDIDSTALGTVLEGILYGAYTVLFILYLILWRHNNREVNWPLTMAQVLLFGLCTLSMCLDIPVDYFFVVPDVENQVTTFKLNMGSTVVFAITDYLSQMILLYRCWIVWDRQWIVVVVPAFLALISPGGGLAFAGLSISPLWATNQEIIFRIYRSTGIATYSISLLVNALATSLIVTKIILTSREVFPVLGSNSRRSLRVVTAMLIESGLLMFAFQLVLVVLFSIQHPAATNMISCTITQIYGITPTLLNIRVIMRSTYEETTKNTVSLRFFHQGTATRTTSPSPSIARIQSRDADTEPNGAQSKEGAVDGAV